MKGTRENGLFQLTAAAEQKLLWIEWASFLCVRAQAHTQRTFTRLFIHLVRSECCGAHNANRIASVGELAGKKTVKTAPRNVYEMANIVNIKCVKL